MNYKILEEMMEDATHQSDLYLPGNYWKFYEKNILKQIKNNDLTKFRSWPGGAGAGNVQSFGGGEVELSRFYNRYFHPFDKKYEKIDNNFILQKYNSLINKLSYFLPFFSYFALRSAEGRQYYFNKIQQYQETLYTLAFNLDKDLLEISDSDFGNPIGIYKNNKFYTTNFLESLIKISFIKKNTNFDKIKSVIELGAGIGLFASCFLKLKKNLKYIVIDIPPTLFLSEYYLRNLGFKVFGYEDLKKNSDINLNKMFEDYQIICLPAWRLDILNNYKSDLFVNINSFQEMEKLQVLNYLKIIKKNINSYIFLNNSIKAQSKTTKKNYFGNLDPASMRDCEQELSDNFSIKYKEMHTGQAEYDGYKTIFEKI